MKCLIIDAVHEAIAQELGKHMQVDHKMLPTQAELAALIPDYDVLIMRVDPAINKEILDAAKNLKVIGVCSVGLNHVDMEAAKAKGVQVFNAPGLNANAVAELTISKMLDLARNTMTANHDVKVLKQWDKYKFVGRELRGRTLGVVGFGRIGRLLNMSRGGIVNEKDAYEALKNGELGGFGSDVLENELADGGLTEGAGFDSPLFELENFLVSPHIGAQSIDASKDIGAHIISKVKEALSL